MVYVHQIQCKVQSFWEGNCEKGQEILSQEKYKATLQVRYTCISWKVYVELSRIPRLNIVEHDYGW